MVKEAKNILLGKSCYECMHFQDPDGCSLILKKIPEDKSCDGWMSYEKLFSPEELKKSMLKGMGIPKEYLYGKKSPGSLA